MASSRREALCISGSTLAGLSIGGLAPVPLGAQAQTPQEPWPDQLVERPLLAAGRVRGLLPPFGL